MKPETASRRRRARRAPQAVTTIHVPKHLLEAIDRLVELGVFYSRSEAFSIAAFEILAKYRFLWEDRTKPQVGYR
jgi:Arc/MetJ-type ribon-helix-helix transcriptional regulator